MLKEEELADIFNNFSIDDTKTISNKENSEICCQNIKCKSTNIISEDNTYICVDCSMIIDKVIDCSAEWRYYGNDDSRNTDPSRCGLPTNSLLPVSSLGSVISGSYRDTQTMKYMRRLQVWNSMPYNERTLLQVFEKFTANTTNMGISSKVINDAKVMYKNTSMKKISRGDNKEGLIAACVFFACNINNVHRSEKEIANMFNIDPIVLTKGNTRFQSLLKLNIQSPSPSDFVSRFGSHLSMSCEDIASCKKLIDFLEAEEIITDNSPTSSTAGIIYFYAVNYKLNISKKDIAEVCSVSEVTITKCYKNLLNYSIYIKKFLNSIKV
jgi:transcription initiation factor TFIIB